MRAASKKTSQIIAEIVEECSGEGHITVQEFLSKMGNRAQAIAILVLALSSVVAGVIPGFSTIAGVPIIFIGLQMALGMKSVWLPKQIREKTISARVISGALAKSVPILSTVERFLQPRLEILNHPYVERVIALVIVVLASVLILPIPGGNFLPSIGISILALSMIERDGVFVLIALGLVFLTGGIMVDLIMQAVHYTQILMWHLF